jgi:DNA-directed RNA polymerase specialized sigma24 family protein
MIPRLNACRYCSNNPCVCQSPWELVQAHGELIARIVRQHVRHDIDDAIADSTILAYELVNAWRRDVPFEHYIARVLPLRLRDRYRSGDALAHVADATIDDIAPVVAAVQTAPGRELDLFRVPESLRAIARMAHVEQRSIAYIVRHTGHRANYVRRMATLTLRQMIGQRNGEGKLPKLHSNQRFRPR